MSFAAKILADSVAPTGARLTTFELTYPRCIHSEIMTHRLLCLAGDAELEFDMPAGSTTGHRRVHRLTLAEFVDKWQNGARRVGSKPKRAMDLSWIQDGHLYSAVEVASRLGMVSASSINLMCRAGTLPNEGKTESRGWLLRGGDVRRWRESSPVENRFDMRARLGAMRIRQLNEDTGDVQLSRVVNAFASGPKEVFEVVAGDYRVAGSADHRVLTVQGWKRIADLNNDGDMLVVRKFGKREEDRLDPLRLKKIGGVWRSRWQEEMREQMRMEDGACRRCRERPGEDIHHVVPVYADPTRAFDPTNITFLCEPCHLGQHRTQGWQGGTYLYGAAVPVQDIIRRGVEDTYDLEIAGQFPNFLANGVVVHNSRNAASSRAIPVEKMLARVEEDPFVPIYWGKNQKGMQAAEELTGGEQERAKHEWLVARDYAVMQAKHLLDLGLHKQIVNRLVEPWMWITVIASATTWTNFFGLRCHKDAEPHFQKIAGMARDLYVASKPQRLVAGEWHIPLIGIDDDDRDAIAAYVRDKFDAAIGSNPADMTLTTAQQVCDVLAKVSVGRCARVSYLTHAGVRDLREDIALHDRLANANPGHWSPFEHVARAEETLVRSGNFVGFTQYRKLFEQEHIGGRMP